MAGACSADTLRREAVAARLASQGCGAVPGAECAGGGSA